MIPDPPAARRPSPSLVSDKIVGNMIELQRPTASRGYPATVPAWAVSRSASSAWRSSVGGRLPDRGPGRRPVRLGNGPCGPRLPLRGHPRPAYSPAGPPRIIPSKNIQRSCWYFCWHPIQSFPLSHSAETVNGRVVVATRPTKLPLRGIRAGSSNRFYRGLGIRPPYQERDQSHPRPPGAHPSRLGGAPGDSAPGHHLAPRPLAPRPGGDRLRREGSASALGGGDLRAPARPNRGIGVVSY